MDIQQRHLLEVSYEAIENVGLKFSSITGSDMGVFIGGYSPDYRKRVEQDIDDLPMFAATGCAEAMLSNRLSYTFDLRGPSLTIDTACSSSLVALHLAFRILQNGESSTALVGSSVIRASPNNNIALSAMK